MNFKLLFPFGQFYLKVESNHSTPEIVDQIAHYLPKDLFKSPDLDYNSILLDFKIQRLEKDIAKLQNSPRNSIESFPNSFYEVHDSDNTRISSDATQSHIIKSYYHSSSALIPYRISIITADALSSREAASFCLRAYRELLRHIARSLGFILIHSSIGSFNDQAVVFMGSKGAGKSAWLLRSLTHGYNYITNDRAFYDTNSNTVYPYPIAAMISKESLAHAPSELINHIETNTINRKDHLIRGYEKIGLTPAELSKYYASSLAPFSKVSNFYILHEANSKTLDLKEQIKGNIFDPEDPTYKVGVYTRPLLEDFDFNTAIDRIISFSKPLNFSWAWFDSSYKLTLFPNTKIEN